MQMIARSISLLKTLFPESSIGNDPLKGTFMDTLRSEAYGVLSQLGGFLRSHPEVSSVIVHAEHGADRNSEQVKLLESFTFSVGLTSGQFFLSSGDSIEKVRADAAMEAGSARLTHGGSELADEIVAAGERCVNAIQQFGRVGYRALMESHKDAFWKVGDLTVTRAQYEASLVGKTFVDIDALFARIRSATNDVVIQQGDLAGPPAFWNRATVSTMADRLKAGMAPQACDSNGISPLVAAVVLHDSRAMKKLIAMGADPNFVDGTGQNPVTASVVAQDAEMLEYLIEHGGNADGAAMMPSMLVALSTDRPNDMVAWLLRVGASVSAVMPDGRPFNEPLDRFLAAFGEGSFMRRQVAELVLSKTTQDAICNELGGETGFVKSRLAKSSLAL